VIKKPAEESTVENTQSPLEISQTEETPTPKKEEKIPIKASTQDEEDDLRA
jgi:hypothetical protein